MLPFLVSNLKCTKCDSTRQPRLLINSAARAERPAHLPSLDTYSERPEDLVELVRDAAPGVHDLVSIDESDVSRLFNDGESEAVADFLFGVDVTAGSVVCPDCQDAREIRDSILFCNE
ncbi:hypothetical protein PAPHI01_1857 [Pancytospora philotis]|nr:hypothetical protein PAPHI01_1857 [Pancytospora philotis]